MRGLTVLVAGSDVARLRAALATACAAAALGGRVRVYAQEEAVPLLRAGAADPDAARLRAAGLPDATETLAVALDSGVAVIACQSGLALAGLSAEQLAPGVETGGLVSLLATLGEDRLLAF